MLIYKAGIPLSKTLLAARGKLEEDDGIPAAEDKVAGFCVALRDCGSSTSVSMPWCKN